MIAQPAVQIQPWSTIGSRSPIADKVSRIDLGRVQMVDNADVRKLSLLEGRPRHVILPSIIAAVAAIAGSFGGAYLSFRNEARKWRQEIHQEMQTHWRDARLSTYREFLIAHRKYLAFVFDPNAHIEARPRPDVQETDALL